MKKNLVGFSVYLVALMAYVIFNKNFKFLLLIGGVFVAVTTATVGCLWIYEQCHRSGSARKRLGHRNPAEVAKEHDKRQYQLKSEGVRWI